MKESKILKSEICLNNMLMNEVTRLIDLQNLLYVWLSKFEKRSLENIKVHCRYLNRDIQ